MASGAPASDGTGVSGSVMGAQQRKNYAKMRIDIRPEGPARSARAKPCRRLARESST